MKKSIRLSSIIFILVALLSWQLTAFAKNNVQAENAKAVTTTTTTKSKSFFTAEINKLIDEDQKLIQKQGYGNLVIPKELHSITNAVIPDNAMYVANKLHEAGYKVYLNGGSVRDFVIGKDSNDCDFSTTANYEECKAIFGNAFTLHYNNGIAYGGVDVNGEHIDLATYEALSPSYEGHDGMPPNTSATLLTDATMRDLTYNAMFYDPFTGDLIDYHGGLYALREHITDTVVDPTLEFAVKPNTYLRVIRFTARYGFTLSDRLDAAMKDASKHASEFPKDANYLTTARLFMDNYSYRCYQLLDKYNLLDAIVPSITKSKNPVAYKNKIKKMTKTWDKKGIHDLNFFEKAAYVTANLLKPRVEELHETMDLETAINTAISEQETVSFLAPRNKKLVQEQLKKLTFQESKTKTTTTKSKSFFSAEINKLIDEDQKLIQKQGYGNLVIPQELHSISNDVIPDNAMYVANKLHEAGYKVYLNGGSVRDFIAGKHSNDCDFSTNATYDECREIFGDALSLHYNNGVAYGGVEVNGEHIDLATYSPLRAAFVGQVGAPSDTTTSLLTDAAQRDLSYNAMYYDPFTGNLIDYHGGLYALREHITDTVLDPEVQLTEDPNSCLRALRFTARYGYKLSDRMDAALKDAPKYISKLPKDSSYLNIARFFTDNYSYKSYKILTKYDVLELMIPSIAKSKNPLAYKAKIKNLAKTWDKTGFGDLAFFDKAAYVTANLLKPRVDELSETMDLETAIDTAISEHETVATINPRNKNLLQEQLKNLTLNESNTKKAA